MKQAFREISDAAAIRVFEEMNKLGSEIRQFRADLESYQSEVRRALILHGDAAVQGAGGSAP